MNKPDEYRTNAVECERTAENSLNQGDKVAWLLFVRRQRS
jgi:hypothetical protein